MVRKIKDPFDVYIGKHVVVLSDHWNYIGQVTKIDKDFIYMNANVVTQEDLYAIENYIDDVVNEKPPEITKVDILREYVRAFYHIDEDIEKRKSEDKEKSKK